VSYLLDTHTWIWSLTDPDRLADRARSIIEDGEEALFVSAASIWELAILERRGAIDVHGDLRAWLAYAQREYPVRHAPITAEIAVESQRVALPHRDPADRFLAATAIVHELVLVTRDRELLAADAVPTIEA
jgi:PIN domain nuclease of toxin-antitoxin system